MRTQLSVIFLVDGETLIMVRASVYCKYIKKYLSHHGYVSGDC